MLTFTSRALFASAFVAFASFSSSSSVVAQQVSFHALLQEFQPRSEEAFDPIEGTSLPNEFGFDVAIRDGLAFIGMPLTNTAGRVAVFTQSTTGWTRTATITASDMTSDDRFGHAVSYRDGLLVVGSGRAAYVYKRINGVWRERQRILPAATDGVGFFAQDLKHEAGVLAIGALGSGTTRDSVFVYEQDASGRFVRRARIAASNDLTWPEDRLREQFGFSISMTNRIIVVGAPVGGPQFTGEAYILGKNSSGNWVRRQKLVAAGLQNGDDYGRAVAVDRGMILVGSPNATLSEVGNDQPIRGRVYGFLPGGTQYVESFQLSQLLPFEPGGLPEVWTFGQSIAMFDTHIAVGGSVLEASSEFSPRMVVATFSRAGSSVQRVGTAMDLIGGTEPVSISIANNLLLVGSPFGGSSCIFQFECIGDARLFHLKQFVPAQ
jgi:hypothetical protein